ncbi:unnamed protein product [Hymenolepis diminuta]|uniref:DUF7041 domain-containing protein n=1 Tax=Hymenolepis diminuta TaxID=6216 RepID=A0A564Z7U4_HYMDI|nr:unnamed protein product [Hymenolepis diminuta]
MSNESELAVNAVVAPITYPILDPRNPYVWFRQVEKIWRLRVISKQKTMFQHVLSALSIVVAAQVIDIVDKAPEDKFYDTLKRAVISRLFDS